MEEEEMAKDLAADLTTTQNLIRWLDNLGVHPGDDVSYEELLSLLLRSGKEAIHETAFYVTEQILDRKRAQRKYISSN